MSLKEQLIADMKSAMKSGDKDRLKIILETNYLETIKVMVSANLGWSILPESMIDSSLVGRQLQGLDLQRPLGIVTRAGRTLSLSSNAMIELACVPIPNTTDLPAIFSGLPLAFLPTRT